MLGNSDRYLSGIARGMDTRSGLRNIQEPYQRRAGLFNRLGLNGHGDYYPTANSSNQYPNPSNSQRQSLLYSRLGLDTNGRRIASSSPSPSNTDQSTSPVNNSSSGAPSFSQTSADMDNYNQGYSMEQMRQYEKEDREDWFKKQVALGDRGAMYGAMRSLSENLFGRKQPNQNLANMTEQYVANSKSDWRYW